MAQMWRHASWSVVIPSPAKMISFEANLYGMVVDFVGGTVGELGSMWK